MQQVVRDVEETTCSAQRDLRKLFVQPRDSEHATKGMFYIHMYLFSPIPGSPPRPLPIGSFQLCWSIGKATLRLLAVVAVQLSRGRASIWLSNTRRGFLSIVQHQGTDRAAIWRGLVRYLCTLVVLSPINKLYWRLLRGLRQQWDQHLTSYFLENFVDEQCIACRFRAGGVVDEEGHLAPSSAALFAPSLVEEQPDQRIAADVGKFVQLCTSLSLDMMDAVIQVLQSCHPDLSCLLIGPLRT